MLFSNVSARIALRTCLPVVALSVVAALPRITAAQAERPATRAGEALDFEREVKPLLTRYCFKCHGARRQKGDIRLDTLSPDMIKGGSAEAWHGALDMINSGEMPPKRAKKPSDSERRILVRWMTEGLRAAAIAKKGEVTSVIRRLNKQQYTNTLQDLLGVRVDFGRVLPDDAKSELGFSNNGDVLQASPLHLDYYRKVARQALESRSRPRRSPRSRATA